MCTGIRLTAKDGTIIHAQTMKFAEDIYSEMTMVPRGYKRIGSTPTGRDCGQGSIKVKLTRKAASLGIRYGWLKVVKNATNMASALRDIAAKPHLAMELLSL
jgi:choloylglycine hydrolase